MAYITRHRLTPTTSAAGAATAYTPVTTGHVVGIVYTKVDYAAGVDVTVTAESSGLAIWTGTDVNATVTVYPRVGTHDTAGAALLYAAGGTAQSDRIPVAQERIKLVIAQGGDSFSGTFDIYVEGA